ncbi:MAG: type II toxin-antitoxin system RelE/ParE family toxin [Bacteroidetes bacterium]|nr:type II toxin-antitoxin system RelE/ParE family toxin [Bacteroidota bacterium]
MASKIVWSTQAEETFDKITDNLLEKWSEAIAVKFVQQAFKNIDKIALFPFSSPAFNDYPDIRRCIINKHVSLFYRIKDDNIELITFHENRRNLDELKLDE